MAPLAGGVTPPPHGDGGADEAKNVDDVTQ